MSEEIEVPIEKIQEDLQHLAHSGEKLMTWGALMSAILAVLAAVSALRAGALSNESMLEQIKAANSWSYYQAKSVKSSLNELKVELMKGHEESLKQKAEQYKKDMEEIKTEATELQHESEIHLQKHEVAAKAVTFFQIAIALTAISALTRRRQFMLGAGVLGLIGIYFMFSGMF